MGHEALRLVSKTADEHCEHAHCGVAVENRSIALWIDAVTIKIGVAQHNDHSFVGLGNGGELKKTEMNIDVSFNLLL